MERSDILEKLKTIINDITEIDKESIEEDSSIMDDLMLSSMEVLTTIYEIENSFSIKISDKDLRSFITVKDIVNYLSEKIK